MIYPRAALTILVIACLLGVRSAAATTYRFQFGPGRVQPGFRVVSPSDLYASTAGFGFESESSLSAVAATPEANGVAARGAITAEPPFFFSVKLSEGNYRVTVTLGDPKSEAVTTVKAETRRLMLERVRTGAGEFVARTFTVNVRTPRISTGGEVDLDPREMNAATPTSMARHWDDKLTLEFSGEHPALAALEIEPVDNAITLFVCGDSTVTDQPGWPAASWGQMITRWFKADVAVANHAESGETLKGFLKERRWDKVLDSVKPGDYVLIEFGTNDSKSRGPQNIYPGQDFAETYAPADTTYKELLRRFVYDVRKHGAHPIIVSPSARRGETAPPTSLQAYATAAMDVARELGIPGIDLNAMGVEINRALGPDADRQFADRTHHVEYGAYLQSKCIVLGLRHASLPIARSVADDFHFDPEHPEPLPGQFDLPPDPRVTRMKQ